MPLIDNNNVEKHLGGTDYLDEEKF